MRNSLIAFLPILGLSLFLTFSCGKSKGEDFSNVAADGPQDPSEPVSDGDNQGDAPREPLPLPKISPLRWYSSTWNHDWSLFLYKAIDKTLIRRIPLKEEDLRTLDCLGYYEATKHEKSLFWITFLASIASQESAFNPRTRYYEDPLNEWSEGLLQLSLSDRKAYNGCSPINGDTILEPLTNLRCGLSILETQVIGLPRRGHPTGSLFPNRYFYWSVLTRASSQLKFIEFFKRHLKDLPFCQALN